MITPSWFCIFLNWLFDLIRPKGISDSVSRVRSESYEGTDRLGHAMVKQLHKLSPLNICNQATMEGKAPGD